MRPHRQAERGGYGSNSFSSGQAYNTHSLRPDTSPPVSSGSHTQPHHNQTPSFPSSVYQGRQYQWHSTSSRNSTNSRNRHSHHRGNRTSSRQSGTLDRNPLPASDFRAQIPDYFPAFRPLPRPSPAATAWWESGAASEIKSQGPEESNKKHDSVQNGQTPVKDLPQVSGTTTAENRNSLGSTAQSFIPRRTTHSRGYPNARSSSGSNSAARSRAFLFQVPFRTVPQEPIEGLSALQHSVGTEENTWGGKPPDVVPESSTTRVRLPGKQSNTSDLNGNIHRKPRRQ